MDRVRPSFMTKEQLDKYMSDVKQNRQPRPRPNFELPAKRLSMTFNDPPPTEPKEEPPIEPITRVQTDSPVSAYRRFGGTSVRDLQRSKGTTRTRNGWIIGDNAGAKVSPFGVNRQPVQPTVEEKKPEITKHVEEESLEDSITKLQNDISQEIENVSILLDSPVDEIPPSPEDHYTEDIEKPDSPAPLKITRTLPVDIKPKSLHSSQMPEPPVAISNTNKPSQYQVNAPPTPSSTPPSPEKRPKFNDRGVPTYAPVAPPTPPTKVMIVEDDKIVGEMTLDEKTEEGYNVQQAKNPNAIAPSSEVSKIASKISELQMKADPYALPPKPQFPTITMEEFQERNESEKLGLGGFSRTNSMPVTMPSQNAVPAKKAYDPKQYKPYRPPTQPTVTAPVNPPVNPPFMRTRTGSESVLPPPCPSPAPFAAIPQHVNATHGRHSSLGDIYQQAQPVQPTPPVGARYGMQHRQSISHPPQNMGRPFQGTQGGWNRGFQNNFGQSVVARGFNGGRSLPVVPDGPKALPEPPTLVHEQVEKPNPPIPTFSFDEEPRRLPSTPQNNKPLPPAPLRFEEKKQESKPAIPTFSFSDDTTPAKDTNTSKPSIPVLNLPDEEEDTKSAPSIPSFSFSTPDEPSTRPLPTPKQDTFSRPLPSPKGPLTSRFETHKTGPGNRIPLTRSAAACTACNQHISARAVSASGLRFHPECFRCSHCSTRLEHVAFYPEPVAEGEDITGRFFCHLDFHEMFSPRCKSCKTPIEGEVVEACGATWHAGHFFCAECGDPFDAKSRFVEKDKYAWCLGCYQKRYSSKCKKCKKPVIETVVKALGGEWHVECFCCFECGGEFGDGRYFLRDGQKEEPVCTKCEETRLKSWELVK